MLNISSSEGLAANIQKSIFCNYLKVSSDCQNVKSFIFISDAAAAAVHITAVIAMFVEYFAEFHCTVITLNSESRII